MANKTTPQNDLFNFADEQFHRTLEEICWWVEIAYPTIERSRFGLNSRMMTLDQIRSQSMARLAPTGKVDHSLTSVMMLWVYFCRPNSNIVVSPANEQASHPKLIGSPQVS
ncbi:hypothetical protein ACI2J5_25345 [Agrobacterium pusense]|uniref:hypothetical protein n=1 Tax=Agrobacterium pusense TaxID=648995 RepID=UPI00384EE6CF